jgi:hypothetical protein
VHRERDAVDRRRVLVTPDAAALSKRVGPVYTRVAERWNDYLAHLDDDQLALLIDVITHAAAIDRDEIERLRNKPPG